MPLVAGKFLTGAVEGDLDEALLRRIVNHVGLSLGAVHGRNGKPTLLRSINGYNNAAQFFPWVVLVDLNGDCDCAPACLQQWIPKPTQHMCFRIAVRAAEAWVLADRERIAERLGLALTRIPVNPDALDNPKRELVNLARRSRRRTVRDDLVPREGSGRAVGPLYTPRMIEFIRDEANGWRPDQALNISDSLQRCFRRLQQFAETAT